MCFSQYQYGQIILKYHMCAIPGLYVIPQIFENVWLLFCERVWYIWCLHDSFTPKLYYHAGWIFPLIPSQYFHAYSLRNSLWTTGCPIIKFTFLIDHYLSLLILHRYCWVSATFVLISPFKRTMFQCSSMFSFWDMKCSLVYQHFRSFRTSNFDGPGK